MDLDLEHAIELVEAGHTIGAALFSNAAKVADGATTRWINRQSGLITRGDRRFIVDASVWLESALGAQIVDNKLLTKRFLEEHGIPHPRGGPASSPREAVALAHHLGGPVVIKPRRGSQGRGVSLNVRGDDAIRSAYAAARSVERDVIVEDYIEIGDEYRLIATADECLAVVKRVLPFVVGDGRHTIRSLVNAKNEHRRLNPALKNLLIPIDANMERTLQKQNLALDDVLDVDVEVTVRDIGGLSGGGEPHECSHTISDEIKSVAIRSVAAIPGLHWAGVDLVTEKKSGLPYIVEVNVNAGYGAATFPTKGRPNDVAMRGWKLRVATNAADSIAAGTPLIRKAAAQPLSRLVRGSWDDRGESPFAQLFFTSLLHKGYEVHRPSPSVVLVRDETGVNQWFAREGSGAKDLLSTRRVTRRHHRVRRYLALAGVPRVRGRLMATPSDLSAYFRKEPSTLVATPSDAPWASRRTREGDLPLMEETLTSSRSSWFVQAYPAGVRVRFFVGRGRSLAAIAAEEDTDTISDEDLAVGSSAAEAAVDAIPDLRWAFVDVVLMSKSRSDDRQRRAIVEGLSTNPQMSQRSWLIAGDPTDIGRTLLDHQQS